MPKRSANATVRLAGQDFWYSWLATLSCSPPTGRSTALDSGLVN